MVSRRFFLLSIVSFLATYLVKDVFKLSKAWAINLELSSLIGSANDYIFFGDYLPAIELYKKALTLKGITINDELSLINNLVKLLQLQEKQLRSKAELSQEYNVELSNSLVKKADNYNQEVFHYSQKAYGHVQAYIKKPESLQVELIRLTQAWINYKSVKPQENLEEKILLTTLAQIPPSPAKIAQLVQLSEIPDAQPEKLLKLARQEAKKIQDISGESLALGSLGKVYEKQEKYPLALKLTAEAIAQARRSQSIPLLYQWLWQAGRIFTAIEEIQLAKNSYAEAIKWVDSLRKNLQLSRWEKRKLFDLYEEFLTLLFELNELELALQVAEQLQVLRLENYFEERCLEVKSAATSLRELLAKTNSALIRIVVLEAKTYLIYVLSNGEIYQNRIDLNKQELKSFVKAWQQELRYLNSRQYREKSAQLFDWIVSPLPSHLPTAQLPPLHLIVLGDGFFNNVPLGALLNPDTKKFLLEEYVIINSLSIELDELATKLSANLLAFGLVKGSKYLPYVQEELRVIANQTRNSEIFIDRDFTVSNFAKQVTKIQEQTILHLASHGVFNGLPETSFLEAYDQSIFVPQLKQILESNSESISLVVLSACETAASSADSILGMVGTAFLAGINQSVGTLWQMSDADIARLMELFYGNLQQGLSVAEALREAQLNQLAQGKHPYQWAAPILLTTKIL